MFSGLATWTLMWRIPPSSATAWSGLSRGLPCHPFLSSTAFTPLPFTVRASTTVGRPVVRSASPKARSMSATSWPSHSTACHPKAWARAR